VVVVVVVEVQGRKGQWLGSLEAGHNHPIPDNWLAM